MLAKSAEQLKARASNRFRFLVGANIVELLDVLLWVFYTVKLFDSHKG